MGLHGVGCAGDRCVARVLVRRRNLATREMQAEPIVTRNERSGALRIIVGCLNCPRSKSPVAASKRPCLARWS